MVVKKLNERGKKTSTGLPFTVPRAKSMYQNIRRIYSTKQVFMM